MEVVEGQNVDIVGDWRACLGLVVANLEYFVISLEDVQNAMLMGTVQLVNIVYLRS